MRKLNNKGISLAELIVSFAIVTVAVIYLYQTLLSVNRMYSKAKTDVNDFSKEAFALRMADQLIDKDVDKYTDAEGEWNFTIAGPNLVGKYKYYDIKMGDKTYKLYKY